MHYTTKPRFILTVCDVIRALLTDCSLKALADKVALKWQKYLQFKAEIYLAYVRVFSRCECYLFCSNSDSYVMSTNCYQLLWLPGINFESYLRYSLHEFCNLFRFYSTLRTALTSILQLLWLLLCQCYYSKFCLTILFFLVTESEFFKSKLFGILVLQDYYRLNALLVA